MPTSGARRTATVLACLLLSSACRDRGKAAAPGSAARHPQDRPALLATLQDQAPGPGGPPAEPGEFFFGDYGGGVAWVVHAGAGARVFHNGRGGKPYATLGAVAISPDGRRHAHGAVLGEHWHMVIDGQEGAGFEVVEGPVFSPDSAHLLYQAMVGGRWHLVVDSKVGAPTASRRYEEAGFAGDSSRIAFFEETDGEGWGTLVVSDLDARSRSVVEARATSLVWNRARSRIAAIATSQGKQRVITLDVARPEQVRRGPAYDSVDSPAFAPDGTALAYAAERDGQRLLVLEDKEIPIPPGDLVAPPAIRPDKGAVGVLMVPGGSMHGGRPEFRQLLAEAPADPAHDQAEGLSYSPDSRSRVYAARRGDRWYVVVGGKEGPPFDRVVSPAFSPDGRVVVYRARKDGKRFVVVADLAGQTLRQHSSHEQVFSVKFTADGKSIAYGVKDGNRLEWVVEPL